jgi:hypothetical protein
VANLCIMKCLKPFNNLIKDRNDLFRWEFRPITNMFINLPIKVSIVSMFHDNAEVFSRLVNEGLLELDDVGMLKTGEEAHLVEASILFLFAHVDHIYLRNSQFKRNK